MAGAKSTPSYSFDLLFLVIKIRPDRGAFICSKICSKKICKSDNYIFIPRMPMPKD